MKISQITKRFSFSAGHVIPDHPGKCSDPHGHNYVVEVSLSRSDSGLAELGMVMDFGDVSLMVKNEILSHIDHTTIISNPKMGGSLFEAEFAEFLKKREKKVYLLPYPTSTAEHLAIHFQDIILKSLTNGMSVKVMVAETNTSIAIADWNTLPINS